MDLLVAMGKATHITQDDRSMSLTDLSKLHSQGSRLSKKSSWRKPSRQRYSKLSAAENPTTSNALDKMKKESEARISARLEASMSMANIAALAAEGRDVMNAIRLESLENHPGTMDEYFEQMNEDDEDEDGGIFF